MGADFYLVLFLKCPSRVFTGFLLHQSKCQATDLSGFFFSSSFSFTLISFFLTWHTLPTSVHIKSKYEKYVQNKILKMASLCGWEIEKKLNAQHPIEANVPYPEQKPWYFVSTYKIIRSENLESNLWCPQFFQKTNNFFLFWEQVVKNTAD